MHDSSWAGEGDRCAENPVHCDEGLSFSIWEKITYDSNVLVDRHDNQAQDRKYIVSSGGDYDPVAGTGTDRGDYMRISALYQTFFLLSRLQDLNETSAYKTQDQGTSTNELIVLITDFMSWIYWIFCHLLVKKSLSSIHSLSRLRRIPRGPEPCGGGEHRGGGVAPLGHGHHHEPDVGQHRHHVEQAQPGGHHSPRRKAGWTRDVHQPGESGQHPPPRIHRR